MHDRWKKWFHTPIGTAVFISLAVFILYLATWQGHVGGYEGETIAAAKALLHGSYEVKRAGIGAVLLYIPLLLIMKIFGLSSAALPSIVPIIFTAATAGLLYLCACFFTSNQRVNVMAAFLVAVGSVMWPYANIGMEYQAMFLLTLLLYTLLRWQRGTVGLYVPSLVSAYLIITKSYGILFTVPFLLFILLELKRNGQQKSLRSPRWWLTIFAPMVGAVLITILPNIMRYGSVGGAYSLAHEFQIWSWWEGWYGIFFSFGKSIFVYSPLLVVTLFYWLRWYREQREVSIFILVSFGLLLVITAPFSYWSDETWAVRKLVPIMPLLHLPMVTFLEKRKSALQKWGFTALVVIAIYVQMLGATFYYGKHLTVLYELNQDSLTSMRFIPELSQPVIFHRLLMSYLDTGPQMLEYTEPSWFRWIRPGEEDVVLSHGVLNFQYLHAPDIVWLRKLNHQ